MVSRTIMVCDRCDKDGETVESAIRREINLASGTLEIDLCAKHNTELDTLFEALEEWREWARPKAKPSRSRSGSRSRSSTPAEPTVQPPAAAPEPAEPAADDPPADDPTTKVIRAWARSNGFDVGDRGRLAPEVIEAYQNRSTRPQSAAAV